MTDAGLATERTALAWQRSALAVLAGAGIVGRLTFEALGLAAIALMLVAAALAALVYLDGRARGRRARPYARRSDGGRRMAALSGATIVLALTEAIALVVA